MQDMRKLQKSSRRRWTECGLLLGIFLAANPAARAADVVSIWGGARGTLVMKSDGTVWTWGANFGGKLGIGLAPAATNHVTIPGEVHGPGNIGFFNSAKIIMGGEMHNVAVREDGTVWAWGANMNTFGLLGNGSTNDASVPMQVSGLQNVVALGGRDYHTLAVESNGTIWAWGWNATGALGNGTTNATLVPVQVVGLTNPAIVSGGYQFSVALMPDGTVYQWGIGRVIGSSWTPQQIPGFSNVVGISCGWDHALALKSNGTVWAWGKNDMGAIGDGSTSNRPSPVQVTGLSNMVAVSGGDSHSSALDADGTIWKWGKNDVGELGNGTTNTVANPVPVRILTDNYGAGFSDVVMMAARDYQNIAVKTDGSVWQWGANDYGQCGDNSLVDRWRPVKVYDLGPRVPLSLKLQPSIQKGQLDLSWPSATGEFFTIQYTTNLMTGFTATLPTNIPGDFPTNIFTLPVTNDRCFYRLKF